MNRKLNLLFKIIFIILMAICLFGNYSNAESEFEYVGVQEGTMNYR